MTPRTPEDNTDPIGRGEPINPATGELSFEQYVRLSFASLIKSQNEQSRKLDSLVETLQTVPKLVAAELADKMLAAYQEQIRELREKQRMLELDFNRLRDNIYDSVGG